jgi:hypothetical protein
LQNRGLQGLCDDFHKPPGIIEMAKRLSKEKGGEAGNSERKRSE